MNDFNSILRQAQKLANEIRAVDDFPIIEKSLSNVLQDAEELHSRLVQRGDQDIEAARMLLSAVGLDLSKMTKKFEILNTTKTFHSKQLPIIDINDLMIQSLPNNEKENTNSSVIEDFNKSTTPIADTEHQSLLDNEEENTNSSVIEDINKSTTPIADTEHQSLLDNEEENTNSSVIEDVNKSTK